MSRHKRHPGGQPGNQNARKHGCYAANLTPQETNEFWSMIKQGNKDPGLAVFYMKLGFVRRYAPGNPRLLREVTALLYKWFRTHHDLDRQDKAEIRQLVCAIKQAVNNENNILPEPTEAKS